MNNLIAIIAGEPNSINSEIIAKAWKKKKKLKNIFIIGSYYILKKQFHKLGIKIPLIKIKKIEDFKKQEKLSVFDVRGNELDVIVDGSLIFGEYTFNWDASEFASGIYYIQLNSASHSSMMKALLMK